MATVFLESVDGDTQRDPDQYGLKLVYEGNNPTVEYACISLRIKFFTDRLCCKSSIIAVHGLNGHWKKTWTAENGVFWLELLQEQLPEARILSYGYDGSTYQSLFDIGMSLVTDISRNRRMGRVSTFFPRKHSINLTNLL